MSEQKDFMIADGILERYIGPGGEVEIPAGVTAIGKGAFRGCEDLTGVTIPEGVTLIDGSVSIMYGDRNWGGAFQDCPKLSRVDLPQSLKAIGDGAFYRCPALTNIDLPEGLETIGSKAFLDCIALTGVRFPSTLREMQNEVFKSCPLSSVVLPEGLTAMGGSIFENCAALQSVVLPSTLEEIPGYAFQYCGNLQSVTISEGVKKIGYCAFQHCKSLQNPSLPDSVEEIAARAFTGCMGITSFHLPRGLRHYDPSVFSGLYHNHRPQTFTIDDSHPVFQVIDGVLYQPAEGLLVCTLTGAQERVTVPDWVTEIGVSAFWRCENLKSVKFSERLTKINDLAFQYCGNLTAVKLPEGLTEIGSGAFEHCKCLSKADLPSTLRTIGSEAFRGTAVTSAVIPEGVTEIKEHTWQFCSKLKKIVIPDSVKKFGGSAFALNHQADVEVNLSPDQSDGKAVSDNAFVAGKHDGYIGAKMLVFPNLPLWTAALPEAKLKMVLGFCTAPEKYPEAIAADYAKYAKSQRRRILAAAVKDGVKGVQEYYDALDEKGGRKKKTAKSESKTPNYKKLSALNKVILLEETVLSGDMEKLEEVLTGCGEFEYTARALGMAGRYGTPEMVKRLLKAGAHFHDGWQTSLKTKYDTYNVYRGFDGSTTVHHYFERMLIEKSIKNDWMFGDFRNIDSVLFPGGREREAAPKEVRMENLRLICKSRKNVCHNSLLLYDAILAGDAALTALLRECGAKLRDQANGFTEVKSCGEREAFLNAVQGLSERKMLAMIDTLFDVLEAEKKTIGVSLPLLRLTLQYASVTDRLLEKGDCKSLKTPELLREVVATGTAGTLAYCIQKGMIKSNVTRDRLIQQSIDLKKTEHTAVLLDYKNKTADFAKERAAEDAKFMRELTAAPDSALMLKKLWTTVKQKDGTLCINGYKGEETEITVPAKIGKTNVTAIGEYAFSPDAPRLTQDRRKARKAITAVTIPEGVTELGSKAFANCEQLEEIRFPERLRSIAGWAFYNCKRLQRVEIPDSVKTMGWNVFSGCTRLSEVVLSKNLKELNGLFVDCISMETVRLPKSVTKIGDSLFARCTALRGIAIPDGVTEIGDYAFSECAALREIVLPETVTAIGYRAFGGCGKLREIILPDGLTNIRSEAFAGCTELREIDLPKSAVHLDGSMFLGCEKLERAVLSSGLHKIPVDMFHGCTALREINIPAGVTEIETRAFHSCEGLEEVTVPGSVETIGFSAFGCCGNLRTVTLGEGVRSIEQWAFYRCPKLELVRLPHSLEFLHPAAFPAERESILLPEDHPHFYKQDGLLCKRDGTLVCCDSSKQGVCQVPEGIRIIGEDAFAACRKLTGVVLPESVTAIKESAFCGCEKLQAIHLPENLEEIGKYAFHSSALSGEIAIPPKVKELPEQVFASCKDLKRVILHNKIKQFSAEDTLTYVVPADSKLIKTMTKRGISFEILEEEGGE